MDKSVYDLVRQIKETHSFLLGNNWDNDGMDFFRALAEYLAKILSVDYVCIDKLLPESLEAQTVAIYFDGHFEDNQKYKLEDTPCSKVQGPDVCFFPREVRHLFPKDTVLQDMLAESYSGITLWAANGRPIGLIAVIGRKPLEDKNLTEMILKQVSIRAAAEMEFLQAREKLEYYETLVETVSEAIISTDEQFTVNSWNKAAERMYGWTEDEVIGVDVSTLFHNQYPPNSSREKAIKILVEEGFWKDEVIQSRKDGTTLNVSSSVTTLKNKNGKIIGIVAINRDITEKIKAREELQDANSRLELLVEERTKKLQQTNQLLKKEIEERIINQNSLKNAEQILLQSQHSLRALTQRIDEIAEEERVTIAREIHDELGHMLTSMKFDIESMTGNPGNSKTQVDELNGLMSMVDSMIRSVQKISTELRPGILDHLGLFPAIEWYLAQFQKRTKICCRHIFTDDEPTFNKTETNVIYRILLEIMTNIARHAKATHVNVEMAFKNDQFSLIVSDNGIGFNPEESMINGSLGILGMNERAISIGGHIVIESSPGFGAKVALLLDRQDLE